MPSDPFAYVMPGVTAPALASFPVTPSDGADLATPIRAITINAGGTLAWRDRAGVSWSTGPLPAGTYPLFASRILATGTTATGLTGWV